MSAEVKLERIWKEYGPDIVLEDISLRVKPGEFVTVVGTSGCGKTTFLKILLGDERPSRGRVLLDGAPMADEPGPERGVVFQRYSVFPHLTVLGNVLVGLEFAAAPLTARIFGAARRRARNEALELLEAVGLGAAVGKYPAELSGGMQQRLAIAQALIKKPKVLLLDEPFGALDPGIRKDMHALILEMWQRTGLTVFMVTHDLKEGFSLGTRLLVFDKVRHDPHAPSAFGACVTYDIPLNRNAHGLYDKVRQTVGMPEPEAPETPRAAAGNR